MAFHRSLSPAKQRDSTPKPDFLSGWKDIANYLNRSVRTVQRHEREFRLPVRRPSGRDIGSVIASRHELDRWVSQNRTRPHHRKRSDSEQVRGLKKAASESLRLSTEARQLAEALKNQSTAFRSGIDAAVQTVSDRRFFVKTEMHKAIAEEQSKRAKEMIQTARDMSALSVEMKKDFNRRNINF